MVEPSTTPRDRRSTVLIAAIALLFGIVGLVIGVPTETSIENGVLLGVAIAVFPPVFYITRSSTALRPRAALLWGGANAAVVYICYTVGYSLVTRLGLSSTVAEVGTFLGVAVVYVGVGVALDNHGLSRIQSASD